MSGFDLPSSSNNLPSSSRLTFTVDDLLSADFGVDTNNISPSSSLPKLPRPVIIDACNVARSHSGPRHEKVSCKGILILVRYFVVRGHKTTSFMPVTYKNRDNDIVVDGEVLDKLYEWNILSFTAARKEQSVRCYDDLYILKRASENGGVVISNDAFRDILQEEKYQEFHDVIRFRKYCVKWQNRRRNGLYGMDRVSGSEPNFKHFMDYGTQSSLYCESSDSNYEVVRHNQMDPTSKEQLLSDIDGLLDKLSHSNHYSPSRKPIIGTGTPISSSSSSSLQSQTRREEETESDFWYNPDQFADLISPPAP